MGHHRRYLVSMRRTQIHRANVYTLPLLHVFVRAEGLRDYFSQFGKVYYSNLLSVAPLTPSLSRVKVDACTIMRDPSGTSRGFAFLTFEDPSAVAHVTAQDHVLDGKPVCLPPVINVRSVVTLFRSTRNAQFLAKSIYEIRGTLSEDFLQPLHRIP